MPWLTLQERVVLSVLGGAALLGMSVLLWQHQRPALTVGDAPTPIQTMQWNESLQAARQVDINTAGVAELERLPGLGPVLAQRIVEDREKNGPFQTPAALSRVKGIGSKTSEALQEYVTTR